MPLTTTPAKRAATAAPAALPAEQTFGSRVVAPLLALNFLVGMLAVGLAAITARSANLQVELVLNVVAIALWGTPATLLLRTRPNDPRTRLFAVAAVAIAATMVFDTVAVPEPVTSSALLVYLALGCTIYFLNPPIVVHIAGSIPRANPLLQRWRWVLPGLYTLAAVLAVGFFFAIGDAIHHWTGTFTNVEAVDAVRVRSVFFAYALGGITGLGLLGYAAAREPTTQGRRQAVVVFAGLLPWTLNMVLWNVWPDLATTSLGSLVHEITVLLPPIALFASIVGYRLFEVGSAVRRALIYGGAIGLLLGLIIVLFDLLDTAIADRFGARVTGWVVAVLLLLGAMLFQPVIESISQSIDRRFFRERVALGELRRRLISTLAEHRSLDTAARHLVQEISTALDDAPVTLLLADGAEHFYHTRAAYNTAGLLPGIPAEWLQQWHQHLRRGSIMVRDRGREAAPLSTALDASEASYVLPISLQGRAVGLLLLGESGGWKLESVETELLEDIARQASAMLENVRLLDLATNDPLTRLPRRHVAEERIAFEIERSSRSGRPFALALADVDYFKNINDSYGHAAGDIVLQRIAQTLQNASRKIDLVSRWGGEEFALLFAETDEAGARLHAEELRAAIATLEIPLNGATVTPTISIGLCVNEGGTSQSTSELVERVDGALYAAKRGGRNRVNVAGDS